VTHMPAARRVRQTGSPAHLRGREFHTSLPGCGHRCGGMAAQPPSRRRELTRSRGPESVEIIVISCDKELAVDNRRCRVDGLANEGPTAPKNLSRGRIHSKDLCADAGRNIDHAVGRYRGCRHRGRVVEADLLLPDERERAVGLGAKAISPWK